MDSFRIQFLKLIAGPPGRSCASRRTFFNTSLPLSSARNPIRMARSTCQSLANRHVQGLPVIFVPCSAHTVFAAGEGNQRTHKRVHSTRASWAGTSVGIKTIIKGGCVSRWKNPCRHQCAARSGERVPVPNESTRLDLDR